jgi:FkbM family methyltransferase
VTRVKQGVKSAFGRLGLDLRRRSSVPFGVRWQDDVWCLMDHYGRPTLIDVGANVDETAQMLVQRFPEATIYSFEPVPAAFAELQQNTARFAGVECVNVALGDAPGEATITTDRQGQNTLMPGISTQVISTVDVNTVDAFCADRRIDRIDLLKIDTEGFEAPVLRVPKEILSGGRVDFVLAECDFIRRRDEHHGRLRQDSRSPCPAQVPRGRSLQRRVDGGGWVLGRCADDARGSCRPHGRGLRTFSVLTAHRRHPSGVP